MKSPGRIVLDTNVLVSGILNPNGKPAQILNLILNGEIIVLYDDRILNEYKNVLKREKFGFTPELVDALIDFIGLSGEYILANPLDISLPDEEDRKFLEVFYTGDALYLVTGNLKHFPGLNKILTPSVFLEKYFLNSNS